MSELELSRREDRVRRMAKKVGLVLRKSRYRNAELRAAHSGYMLIDPDTNMAVAGAHPSAFSLTLDGVEQELRQKGAPGVRDAL